MHEYPCIPRQGFHQSERLEVQCALISVQEEKVVFASNEVCTGVLACSSRCCSRISRIRIYRSACSHQREWRMLLGRGQRVVLTLADCDMSGKAKPRVENRAVSACRAARRFSNRGLAREQSAKEVRRCTSERQAMHGVYIHKRDRKKGSVVTSQKGGAVQR